MACNCAFCPLPLDGHRRQVKREAGLGEGVYPFPPLDGGGRGWGGTIWDTLCPAKEDGVEGMTAGLTPARALTNAFQVRLDVATPRVRLAGWPGASPSFMATRRA